MRYPIAILLVVAAGRPASANQPYYTDEKERVEHWSWVPLLSALYAFDSAADDQTSGVFGAQFRLRYGTARAGNSLHRQDRLRLWSFGLGVETVEFDTFEPSVIVGRHWLPKEGYWWGGPIMLDVRVDVGVGYAWSRMTDQPFVNIKAGVGAMFTRRNDHSNATVRYDKLRFRQQIDFILQTQIARDGEWRLGFGIELDVFRLLADVATGSDGF